MNKEKVKYIFRKTVAVFPLCLMGGGSIQASQPNGQKPSILFIMSDDHTTQAISAYKGILSKYLPTPNIDRIGNEGAIMSNCFVTNSISTPSRASILTGQYSQKNGVYTLSDVLDRNHPTVAKELQKAGYQTAIIGKWHLSSEPDGFDFYNVLPGQGRYLNPLLIEKGNWHKGKGNGKEFKGHSTDVITNEVLNYLQAIKKDQPFFLMCHFKAPHRPWQPAERYNELLKDTDIPEPDNLFDSYEGKGHYAQRLRMSMEDMRKADLKGISIPENMTRDEKRRWVYQHYIKDYLRCVAGIDENIGKILKYLDDNGLTENTVVIYTGDQGFFLGEHGWFDKRLMYEESLRMPFLIRYPDEIKPGTVNDDMVMNIDFAPLFLDYAKVPKPDYMQGESFRNNLKGKTTEGWRKSIYYRYWMHADESHDVTAHYGIRTDRYKLIFYYGQPLGIKGAKNSPYTPEWEFYDLKNDPNEMHNIYDNPSSKHLIPELKKELVKLKKKYEDEDNKYPVMQEISRQYW